MSNYIPMGIKTDEEIVEEYLMDNYMTEIKPLMQRNARNDAMRKHWAVTEILDCIDICEGNAFEALTGMSKEFHNYANIAPTPRQVITFVCICDIIDDCLDVLRAKRSTI